MKFCRAIASSIESITVTKDNQNVYIIDRQGEMRRMVWKSSVFSSSYEFTEIFPTKVGNANTTCICVTHDNRHLLIGTNVGVRVFDTQD